MHGIYPSASLVQGLAQWLLALGAPDPATAVGWALLLAGLGVSGLAALGAWLWNYCTQRT